MAGEIYNFTNTSTGRLGTIQNWTVPESGIYKIEAWGAGGQRSGGLGARISGEFRLVKGEVLQILVGQEGNTGGGGGGTFVTRPPHNTNESILVIAGGGGGGHNGSVVNDDAPVTSSGLPATTGGNGGANGNGGIGTQGSGGGGFFTNGSSGQYEGGYAYINGGQGALRSNPTGDGGFGGGGAHGSSHAAGGGGYSGGGGAETSPYHGGGGGSYNNGENQDNSAGAKSGHGQATITFIKPLIETRETIGFNSVAFILSNTEIENTYHIEYGTTTSFGTSIQVGVGGGNLAIKIPNLQLNTIYYYRIYAINGSGVRTDFETNNFRTKNNQGVFSGITATNRNYNSISVGGSLESVGDL